MFVILTQNGPARRKLAVASSHVVATRAAADGGTYVLTSTGVEYHVAEGLEKVCGKTVETTLAHRMNILAAMLDAAASSLTDIVERLAK